jgi:hypothetical protein
LAIPASARATRNVQHRSVGLFVEVNREMSQEKSPVLQVISLGLPNQLHYPGLTERTEQVLGGFETLQ